VNWVNLKKENPCFICGLCIYGPAKYHIVAPGEDVNADQNHAE